MKELSYLSEEDIITLNSLAILKFDVKKADEHKVLNQSSLTEALDKCRNKEGDIYDKATILLISLIRAHAFTSGNRRTALIATLDFLARNNTKSKIGDDPENNKIFIGIREGSYSKEEIKDWIKNGKIKKFER
ncbi:MAG: type II toxin-antitoxin system death-on-curing family toxin [Nanoarchaeota archaeon]